MEWATITCHGRRRVLSEVDAIEYDCAHCGLPLYFDTASLHFKHKALLCTCQSPLAQAVRVVVGILVPEKTSPVIT